MKTREETRRPTVWRELVLGLVLFAIYLLVDSLDSAARRVTAHRNAVWLQQIEQWLHIDVESWANQLLAPHHLLAVAANYEYATTYIISAALLLVLSYWRSPAIYRLTRNSFIILNLLAFACFWLFPVMPPRMLAGQFVDTVARDGTIGSWGSPLVSHANQLAAMPSLHMAWALWVSVMLARLSHAHWIQVVSAVHVAVTFIVVTVTANHFVLDTIGAAVVVTAGVVLAEIWTKPADGLATADEFFLNVEKAGTAQNVGGYVHLSSESGEPPSLEQVRELARTSLGGHRRFVSRLVAARGRYRWEPAPSMDWAEHVSEIVLPAGSTPADLDAVVARLHAERMPIDRPLWRIVLITGLPHGKAAFVVLMHHCMADGVAGIAQLLSLVRPQITLPSPDTTGPSRLQSVLGVAAGLARLATDGRPASVLPPSNGDTQLHTVQLEFDRVRAVARTHGVRVTELLMALTASSVAAINPAFAEQIDHRLRVSVPVMLGVPGDDAEGNTTAAVILDAPCRDLPTPALLAETRAASAPLRTPTRALASRWVMSKALAVLPSPARAAFARTVYGRRFFHAIVSNVPGQSANVTLAGARMDQVHPLLPPAPGAPLTVGALTWNGKLGISITTDPDVLDADRIAKEMQRRFAAMCGEPSQSAVSS